MKIEVKALGEIVMEPKIVYSGPRKRCIGKVQASKYSNPEGRCKSNASYQINGEPYCEKHAGKKLLDLHLNRVREEDIENERSTKRT